MNVNKLVDTLIKATKNDKITWNVLSEKHYAEITNISSGIVDAYYFDYNDDTSLVLYQYKHYNHNEEVEEITYYISFTDKNFKYKYEISPGELEYRYTELISLYKLVQRKTHKIDNLVENLIKELEEENN